MIFNLALLSGRFSTEKNKIKNCQFKNECDVLLAFSSCGAKSPSAQLITNKKVFINRKILFVETV